jgi:hypothetical protein
MRIAIIVRLLWPGGVQRIAIEETRGLQQLGHDVLLLFLRRSSLPYDYLKSERVKVDTLDNVIKIYGTKGAYLI